MNYFFVIIGIALLIFGGELLVRGAVSLAVRLKVSTLLIALTIIAFGTSTPELLVSIDAALSGSPELTIGNIIGSNIANVLLILGLPAILTPIFLSNTNPRDLIILISAYLLLVLFALNNEIIPYEGIILFIFLLFFLILSYQKGKKDRDTSDSLSNEVNSLSSSKKIPWIIFFIIIGIILLFFGSDFLIKGAVGIAKQFNVPKEIIGLSVLAIGTSLPELTTSIIAAIKKQNDFIIGNVIGSNIFNTLGVAGITSFLIPIPVKPSLLEFDFIIMFLSILCLIPLILFKIKIGRIIGSIFFSLYILYIIIIF